MVKTMLKSRNSYLQHVGNFTSRYRRSVLGVSCCAILGILTASLMPQTPPPSVNDRIDWILPQIEQQPLPSDINTILANPLFGGEPVVSQEAETETLAEEDEKGEPWRLIGIMTEGNTKHVVILNEISGKSRVARLGETLPGGEELVAVRANEIEIFHNDKSKKISLFVDRKIED